MRNSFWHAYYKEKSPELVQLHESIKTIIEDNELYHHEAREGEKNSLKISKIQLILVDSVA